MQHVRNHIKNRQGQVFRFLRDYGIAPVFSGIKGMQEALFGKADGRGYFPVPELAGADHATLASFERKGVVRYSCLRDG